MVILVGGMAWLARGGGPLQMPYLENLITTTGFCPSIAGEKPPVFPAWVWPAITLVSAVSLLVAGALWIWPPAQKRVDGSVSIPYLAGLLLAAPTLLYTLFWDDYLLPFVPIAILAVLDVTRGVPLSRTLCGGAFAMLAAFSMISEHDYLAWNRARWEVGNRLIRSGIPVGAIDGGFEWNGWYHYEKEMARLGNGQAAPQDVEAWERSLQPRYVLAFSPLPGCTVVDAVSYAALFPPRHRQVYALTVPPAEPSSRDP